MDPQGCKAQLKDLWKLIGTAVFLIAGALAPPRAAAQSRGLSLYPEQDIRLNDKQDSQSTKDNLGDQDEQESWKGAATLFATFISPPRIPCLIRISHASLAYEALQMGASCAVDSSRNHIFALEIYPEAATRTHSSTTLLRPSLLVGMVESFKLNLLGEKSVLFGSVHYKFAPREKNRLEAEFARPNYNPFYLQRWADVIESSYILGWVRNFERNNQEAFATRFSFQETLPLGLRRIGALQDSAAVQAKILELSVRARSGHYLWGGGIGYAVITFDALRVGLPLPSVFVGYQW